MSLLRSLAWAGIIAAVLSGLHALGQPELLGRLLGFVHDGHAFLLVGLVAGAFAQSNPYTLWLAFGVVLFLLGPEGPGRVAPPVGAGALIGALLRGILREERSCPTPTNQARPSRENDDNES